MVISVSLAVAIATAKADAMNWGMGATIAEASKTVDLRDALIGGTTLVMIPAAWIVILGLVWRRTDELSRWTAAAAVAAWVVISGCLSQFRAFIPWLHDLNHVPLLRCVLYESCDWGVMEFQTEVFLGAIAGALAFLYARKVTYRIGLKKWGNDSSASPAEG